MDEARDTDGRKLRLHFAHMSSLDDPQGSLSLSVSMKILLLFSGDEIWSRVGLGSAVM